MPPLTEAGRRLVADTAQRHGLSEDAVTAMLAALSAGGGTQAQFTIPELGGMGQWSQGGMTMVGDMFNDGLKARVNALCADLAQALAADTLFAPPPMQQSQSQGSGGPMGAATSYFQPDPSQARWPAELGPPSSQGSQNDLHYAVFPQARRLAISAGGRVTVYDTGDHQIGGVGQAQSGGQSLTFTSQHGLVRVDDLPVVRGQAPASAPPAPEAPMPWTAPPEAQPAPPAAQQPALPEAQQPALPEAQPTPPEAQPTPPAAQTVPDARTAAPGQPLDALTDDQIFTRLERLADLRDRGILSEEEFAAKKAELLARL